MSVRAAAPFTIRDENDSSFQRGILKQKDPALMMPSNAIPMDSSSSVIKPSVPPKSERKALTTLNTNTLNNRVLPNNGKPGLGNGKAQMSSNLVLKPATMDKKPKIQLLQVAVAPVATTTDTVMIPEDEEFVCSGSSIQSWEDMQSPLDSSLLQYEKYQLITAADEEREQDRVNQEERDRVRAENVMLEELAKEMTDLFDENFSSLDYFN